MCILTILGPTASGKTALAVALAEKINGAVLSADSRQVFRGMDIGTGKDLEAYGDVPYYLLDIREAGDHYHVAAYREDFLEALSQVRETGKVPVLCGGTGLYLQAALQGLPYAKVPVNPPLRRLLEEMSDEELLAEFRKRPSAYSTLADTSTRKRLIRAIEIASYLRKSKFQPDEPSVQDALVIGIQLPVIVRRNRITRRLHQRLDAGLLREVGDLLGRGVPAEKLIFYGLEYKFAMLHLQGELDMEQMTARLNTAIHQFAKRQMTFFRKLEKDGMKINWIDGTLPFDRQVETAFQLWKEFRVQGHHQARRTQ